MQSAWESVNLEMIAGKVKNPSAAGSGIRENFAVALAE